ncbi:MAG: sialidase family protein [Candidatus Methanoperedens sp.]|nr:sialidase family protein [Candidatus Methanoperedens sp.]
MIFSIVIFLGVFIVGIAPSSASECTLNPGALSECLVSPSAVHFPQNKQNEAPMAVNPRDPDNAITGANDLILEPDCTPATDGSSSCPFDPETSVTGIYWTKDGGNTWKQTVLDWFSEFGLVSDGDPVVAFGPKPKNGQFSWSNGVRAYFGTLIGSPAFGPDKELLGIAYSDDGGETWSSPVIATTRDNPVNFNDKIAIWVDANDKSPYFGNVYVSWTLFIGSGNFGESNTFNPEPIMFSRSIDGGRTFEKSKQLSQAFNNGAVGGRQGSVIRTGNDGTVYVFWDGTISKRSAVLGARSDDGGKRFGRPFPVTYKSDVPSPFPGASFRVNSFPMADVRQSDGKIFVVWADYSSGHSVVKMTTSSNKGASWTSAQTIANIPGRSAFYPSIALKPDGKQIFVGFNAIDDNPSGTAPGAKVVSYDAYYVISGDSGNKL